MVHDIAFSCDNNGAPFLNVAVYSLLAHYQGEVPLRINIFEGYGGHSEESKAKLKAIIEKANKVREESARTAFFSLRYHNVEKYLEPYAELILNREKSRWNVFTWTPIFTPQILADAEGACIHFDIDMLFNADITELFNVFTANASPLSPQPLIACTYEYDKYGDNAGKVVWEKGILPPTVERYFNTGVLVFNTEACRKEKTWEKIIAWYREHYDIADRIEQDAWNALYHDRIFPLSVAWNFHDRNIKNYAKWKLTDKYWLGNPPVECLVAALEPKLLHFWGPKKPWKASHRPYRKLYHAAMAAVGQSVPEEEFLAPYHNLHNVWLMHKVAARIGRSRPFSQRIFRSLKAAARFPFEWLGIGLGIVVLPRVTHSTLLRLADLSAAVMYRFDGHGKRLALENLRIVEGLRPLKLPPVRFDPEKSKYDPSTREELLIRGSYRNMARTVAHIFWTFRQARERVAATGELSLECREFLQANRPAVTVSAHVGCWEILSQLAFLEGHKMMSVAKNIGTGAMTRLLMKARRSIGQEIVSADGAFRPLLKGIRQGKSLGLLVDQSVSPKEGGVWVWFFGRPMCVSAAPAFFAVKTKTPVIVAWSRPLPGGRYRCEVAKTCTSAGDDIAAFTQVIAIELERIIRRHPSRWVMNYDFFRYWPTKSDYAKLEATR